MLLCYLVIVLFSYCVIYLLNKIKYDKKESK